MSNFVNKIDSYSKNKFSAHKEHYGKLADGQSPDTLLITCSDSRLCPNEFSETTGGEVFIIRNAGNLMPGYNEHAPSNEGLTLEYGVCALGVKEVIVCGHASCGAMGGLKDTDSLSALPLVQKGLELYKEANLDEVSKIDTTEELISWNVKNQLKSIYGYPFIKERIESGALTVTGIVYDFVHGSATKVASLNADGSLS